MTYERMTAAPIREALRLAEEVLTSRLPMKVTASHHHSIRLEGGDGTVTITGHRHGMDTQVHAATDQLRTSRLDLDVQYFMTLLPYQPGEQRGAAGQASPAGLQRL
ncbi:MAG TPA: hypothetical protein VK928_11490 [Longimicrobiales bacterium]|nr:hypothetical protein [Longimicrobiales bacterium]